MKRLLCTMCALLSLCLAAWVSAHPQRTDEPAPDDSIRFEPIEVWIETGGAALAAYQIDISATSGNVAIVGIEGGAHAPFAEPPYYDHRAMQSDRVIVADFSTAAADALPTGRTRIVTLHVQVTGGAAVTWKADLQTAADADGNAIAATVELVKDGQT